MRLTRSRLRPCFGALLFAFGVCLPAAAAEASAAGDGLRVHAHAIAQIESNAASPNRLKLHTEGETLELEVQDNVELLSALTEIERASVQAQARFLEGRINGIDGSWLRLTELQGQYSGVYFDGRELMLLDRVDTLGGSLIQRTTEADDALVVYRLDDVEMPGLLDDMVSVPGYPAPSAPKRTDYAGFARHLGVAALQQDTRNPVRQMRLTVVTDTEFSSVHGSNRDAVVASRVNVVDGIYSTQFQTRIVVGTLRHLSTNGTLNTTVVSGSDTLLTRFRTYMVSGDGSGIAKGGLNHLFSGKDFDGSTVGVAYVSTLCSSTFGYGINQVRAANTTTALTIAHEMGHNFGASHDGQTNSVCQAQTGSWLMSPSLNGSSTFSPCSRTSIQPRIDAATCFQPVTVESLIFRSGFELQ